MDESKKVPLGEDELRTIEQEAGSGFRPPPEAVLRLVEEVRRLHHDAPPLVADDTAADMAEGSIRSHDAEMERQEALSLVRMYLERAGIVFTSADVGLLREMGDEMLGSMRGTDQQDAPHVLFIADRLAALLTPRDG